VGAATDADIVDLAGATDVAIAALPGGHTSKPVSAAMLLERNPDCLVFQLQSELRFMAGIYGHEGVPRPTWPLYARRTEVALGNDPLVLRTYHEIWRSPEDLPIVYIILSRTELTADPPAEPWKWRRVQTR
jgi:hypothetical protein